MRSKPIHGKFKRTRANNRSLINRVHSPTAKPRQQPSPQGKTICACQIYRIPKRLRKLLPNSSSKRALQLHACIRWKVNRLTKKSSGPSQTIDYLINRVHSPTAKPSQQPSSQGQTTCAYQIHRIPKTLRKLPPKSSSKRALQLRVYIK